VRSGRFRPALLGGNCLRLRHLRDPSPWRVAAGTVPRLTWTLCVTRDYLAVGSDGDSLIVPMGLPTALVRRRRVWFRAAHPAPGRCDLRGGRPQARPATVASERGDAKHRIPRETRYTDRGTAGLAKLRQRTRSPPVTRKIFVTLRSAPEYWPGPSRSTVGIGPRVTRIQPLRHGARRPVRRLQPRRTACEPDHLCERGLRTNLLMP